MCGRLPEIVADPGLDIAVVVMSIQNSRAVLCPRVFHQPMFFTNSKTIKPASYSCKMLSLSSITHPFPFSHHHHSHHHHGTHHRCPPHHHGRTRFARRRVPGGVRQGQSLPADRHCHDIESAVHFAFMCTVPEKDAYVSWAICPTTDVSALVSVDLIKADEDNARLFFMPLETAKASSTSSPARPPSWPSSPKS